MKKATKKRSFTVPTLTTAVTKEMDNWVKKAIVYWRGFSDYYRKDPKKYAGIHTLFAKDPHKASFYPTFREKFHLDRDQSVAVLDDMVRRGVIEMMITTGGPTIFLPGEMPNREAAPVDLTNTLAAIG